MAKTAWLMNSKVVTDAAGRILLCEVCPCDDDGPISWGGGCTAPSGTLVPRVMYMHYGRNVLHSDGFNTWYTREDSGPISLQFVPSLSPGGSMLLYYQGFLGTGVNRNTFTFSFSDTCLICLTADLGLSLSCEPGFETREILSFCCTPSPTVFDLLDKNLYFGIPETIPALRTFYQFPCINKDYDWLYVTTRFGGLTSRSYSGCPLGVGP